ncbi:N-acetylmuramoyl-L-alanine amidase [Paenibacillus apiarius]|uniref:N-acetylmuramoyl-L-alanine amidase n=1 Tax=Paenibacillus apiarius TaxID=46240 RepID=UPI003B3A8D6A
MEIKQRLLPDGRPNKPTRPMKPAYITIHNTDNTKPDATAEAHSRYVLNGSAGRQASWHYTVDDEEIYQHLRDDEQGWHCTDGNGPGNSTSIGIEVCMFDGMDEEAAWKNAAWLASKLVRRHGLSLQRVVPHGHWTKKNCPSRILPHWSRFLNMIDRELNTQDKPQPKPEPSQGGVTIEADGRQVKGGIIIGGVTYAPVRALAEAYGLKVAWNQAQKKVTVSKGATE